MGIRKLGAIIPVLLLGSALVSAHPQETRAICTCKPREVGESGSRIDWDGYRKGIVWHYSVDEAMKIAKAEGKLVFWYHLVGDLDKEGC